MRRRLHFGSSGRGPHDPWFRIGTLDVDTTMFVVLVSVASLLTSAMLGFGSGPVWNLALDPYSIAQGEVWRAVTWPLGYINARGVFWDALAIFFFWYFGREIEQNVLGRKRMAWLVGWIVAIFSSLSVLLYAVFDRIVVDNSGLPPYGLSNIEFMVILLWVAEWPTRRFFFNIPAWAFGGFLVAVQLIEALGERNWMYLLFLVLALPFVAIVARSLGMLAEHHALPRLSMPHRRHKPKKGKRKFSGPTVVSGPWAAQQATQGYPSSQPAPSRDEARMDALLEKIHAEGQDALSAKEKAELLELRERMRRRP